MAGTTDNKFRRKDSSRQTMRTRHPLLTPGGGHTVGPAFGSYIYITRSPDYISGWGGCYKCPNPQDVVEYSCTSVNGSGSRTYNGDSSGKNVPTLYLRNG